MTLQQIEDARKAAMKLFAEDLSNAEIARRIGVSRSTVSIWHTAFNERGPEALNLKSPGRTPKLSHEQLDRIREAMLQGPQAHGYDTPTWTLERVTDLIERLTGVQHHPGYVWYLLGRMGFSRQKHHDSREEEDSAITGKWVYAQAQRHE